MLVAVAAPGCGDGGGEDDEKSIRTAYVELQDRFEARDAKGVCEGISKAAKEQVGSLGHEQPTTCVKDVRVLFKWMKRDGREKAPRPKVKRVATDGDRATVTAGLSASADGRIRFVEEDGEWKLDSFFSISGPPPPDMQ